MHAEIGLFMPYGMPEDFLGMPCRVVYLLNDGGRTDIMGLLRLL
jgi:hypothetical protein